MIRQTEAATSPHKVPSAASLESRLRTSTGPGSSISGARLSTRTATQATRNSTNPAAASAMYVRRLIAPPIARARPRRRA